MLNAKIDMLSMKMDLFIWLHICVQSQALHMYICEPRKLLQGCANAHGRVGLLFSLGVAS